MRITNNMLIKDMMWNVNSNLGQMSKYNKQLSSGQRVHRPSDDPVGVTQILKLETDIRITKQFHDNAEDGHGMLSAAETSMSSIKEMLHRIRELTVQGANQSISPEDSKLLKKEVDQLIEEIIVTGNSTVAGKYLFSGLQTDTKLFNTDGTYNLDMTTDRVKNKYVMEYELGVGETMKVAVHPVDLFGLVKEETELSKAFSVTEGEAIPPKQPELKLTLDPTSDLSGETLDITYDGMTFDVPEANLTSTLHEPMTKERLIDALKNAKSGTVTLQSVANIFFDKEDNLIIRAKEAGTAKSFTAGGITVPAVPKAGKDKVAVTLEGTKNVTDADIAAAEGIQSMSFAYDGKSVRIDVDMTALTTVDDYKTEVQNKLDAAFGAGKITANFVDGQVLKFTISEGKLKADSVVGTKSLLIEDLRKLAKQFEDADVEGLNKSLEIIDGHMDRHFAILGEIGGKSNRIGFIKARLKENEGTFEGLLSKVKFIDYAEYIMLFKNLENVYRASLSVGSKVIQPTLVDFLR